MPPLSYKISPALESHIPFVYNSFLRSYSGTFPMYLVNRPDYFRTYHDLAEKAIEELGVLVAHPAENPDQIIGYIVGNSGEIFYVYVKQDYRGLGIATDLVKRVLTGEQQHICGPTEYKILTRSGAGLLKYLSSYVLQDADFCYKLPTEVKKNAVRKEKEKQEGQGRSKEVIEAEALASVGMIS